MSVLTGEFTAKMEDKEFGIKAAATFAVFWLDLDRDGIFETAGDNGSERLNVGTEAGDKVVELLEGTYKVAIAHGVTTERLSLTYTSAHLPVPGLRCSQSSTQLSLPNLAYGPFRLKDP